MDAIRAENGPATQGLYRDVWRISGRQQIWLSVLSMLIVPLAAAPLELQRRIINKAIGRLDLETLWVREPQPLLELWGRGPDRGSRRQCATRPPTA